MARLGIGVVSAGFRPDPEPPREETWDGTRVRCYRIGDTRITYAPCYRERIPAMAGWPDAGVAIEAPTHREWCLPQASPTCPVCGAVVIRLGQLCLDREGASVWVEWEAARVRRDGIAEGETDAIPICRHNP